MKVKYEIKMTLTVEEEPDNPFPVDAFSEVFQMEDNADGIIESTISHTREVLPEKVGGEG